ncbi:MAG: hypothetical protein JNL08_15510 [Planctomycetes bacterium]|nr:hypothetical protein [Planctomycetota bacterium]
MLAAAAAAQGPVYRERWGYLHLEQRRAELLHALRGADEDTLRRAADVLAGPDDGVPFVPVARALAAQRGVTADATFQLRSLLSAYVLPEIADPDGSNEACRRINVTLFAPFAMPLPGALVFDFELIAADGSRVWSAQLDLAPTLEDLRMARLVAPIPTAELPDGTYFVRVVTRVDGAAPGPHDPTLQWRCHVLRGYQSRSEAAFAALPGALERCSVADRPLLAGIAHEVRRAYSGDAFDGDSDAVGDLQRLERALQNVADERPVLAGITGFVPVWLDAGEPRGFAAVVRLPADFAPGQRRGRPLVVFAAATPAYDTSPRRPTAPGSRGPRWGARELGDFGAALGCDAAWLESPGELRDYPARLRAALAALRDLFGSGDAEVLLVCDGEAAAVAALHIGSLQAQLQGLVLVGSGALSGKAIDGLGALPVRLQPVPGRPGSEGLERSLAYAAGRDVDVARLGTRPVPWPLALPLLQSDLEAFAARVLAR